jgi:hypothetical protein
MPSAQPSPRDTVREAIALVQARSREAQNGLTEKYRSHIVIRSLAVSSLK